MTSLEQVGFSIDHARLGESALLEAREPSSREAVLVNVEVLCLELPACIIACLLNLVVGPPEECLKERGRAVTGLREEFFQRLLGPLGRIMIP